MRYVRVISLTDPDEDTIDRFTGSLNILGLLGDYSLDILHETSAHASEIGDLIDDPTVNIERDI